MSLLDTTAMPERIERWLATNVAPATVERYTIMTGGFSRVMARVDLTWADGRAETLVLRGDPPAELATLDSDRDAEWALLSALGTIESLRTPRARWYVDDPATFGAAAMFMEFVDGPNLQTRLLDGADHDQVRRDLIDLAAAVAAIEAEQLPATIPRPPTWGDHVDAIIGRWEAVADRHVESLPFVRYITAWLRRRLPAPAPLRLVHGDFQASNIVCSPDGWQVVDWEFARIGDPREDLGYYNAYSAAVPPNLTDGAVEVCLARFRERTGLTEEQVNPVSFGYFTVLSTISAIEGLYSGISAFARGERRGVAVAFNAQLVTIGNANFVGAIDAMEAALATTEAT